MKQNVEVPQVGESITSGILATWLKQDGEMVQEGDDLFELETDKATMPVPAPTSGILSIRIQADEEVEIGMVVAVIDTEGQAGAGDADTGSPERSDDAEKHTETRKAAHKAAHKDDQNTSHQDTDTQTGDTGGSDAISPAVRRVLDEYDLDAGEVAGAVTPSGKGGRLTKADVEAYQKKPAAGTKDAAPKNAAPPAPSTPQGQAQERKKMSPLRRTIAANLVRSKQESAHLTTFNEVDMSAIMDIRGDYKDSFEKRHGVRLGFMSFFIKAAQRALVEYPAVNAFIEGEEIVYNHYYNVGVAISTDKGLIVPVIRNVETLSFAQIETTIIDFAGRAKEKRIMPDEFTGGTFTITNGGVFGSMLSTPIPSPPQTAVLGMHSIQKRAVVVDDEIVIRPMMYLAITYDHRVIDGREAISFLNGIKNRVEDPTRLLLDV